MRRGWEQTLYVSNKGGYTFLKNNLTNPGEKGNCGYSTWDSVPGHIA